MSTPVPKCPPESEPSSLRTSGRNLSGANAIAGRCGHRLEASHWSVDWKWHYLVEVIATQVCDFSQSKVGTLYLKGIVDAAVVNNGDADLF